MNKIAPVKRKNGFDYPRSINQIITAAVYLFTIAAQFLLISVCCTEIFMIATLAVHTILSLAVFSLWLFCTQTDPECLVTDKPIPECTNLFGHRVERANLYCSTCCKRIYGMDHHCVFLNNCIGSRNYLQFTILLGTAFVHLLFDIALVVRFELHAGGTGLPINNYIRRMMFHVLMGLQISLCSLFALGVGILIGLHIFLNFVALRGTFNWVLYRRDLRGGAYHPYQMEEDHPSVMGEISNSFSSHMFHNRSRNYSAPQQRSFSRNLENVEEGELVLKRNSLISISDSTSLDSRMNSSKKTRLFRSDLLKQKAASIYPENQLMAQTNSESQDLEEQFEIQLPNLSSSCEEGGH